MARPRKIKDEQRKAMLNARGQTKARNTRTHEQVVEEFRQAGFVLLSRYENTKSKLEYICSCGEKSTTRYDHFRNGHKCRQCGCKQRVETRKKLGSYYTHSFMKKAFQKTGCELLEDIYVNSKTKMKYRCSCGDVSEISWDNFNKGKRCNACGIKRGAKKILGENNHFWNPNLKDEERNGNRKNDTEHNKWRRSVYERDSFSCQVCGETKGGQFNAHHLYNYATYKGLRYDIKNGVTLCVDCHKEFHRIYGIKNNTEMEYEEFKANNQATKIC